MVNTHAIAGSLSLALVLVVGPSVAEGQIPAVKLEALPTIGGTFDESWEKATIVTSFQQLEPALHDVPRVRTEVFVGYDEQHWYVAARLWQRRNTVRAGATRRDGKTIRDGDFVTFVLDPLLSGNSAYFLTVNPSGTVADGVLTASAEWNTDWDGVWSSSVGVFDDYWLVEIALPLSTIGFQPAAVQNWGFLAIRHYAEGQELDLSALADANTPYRIDTLPRIVGLEGLKTRTQLTVQPYVYAVQRSDTVSDMRSTRGKFGGDVRIGPSPNLTILATARPDYAQLESDQEIINVTDVPTAYPEKRPFFTESSDLYQALAVNTRNIGAIDAGVKVRHVLRTLRYDVTGVRETNGARWLLGDARLTDNRRYLAEVITGTREQGGRRDYNVTTHLQTWVLQKRLTASNWLGTINGQAGKQNEFETVNTLRWTSRTLDVGVGNRVKTALYNPNIVGYNALSNELLLKAWASPSFIREQGLLRRMTPTLNAERMAVYSGPGAAYTVWYGTAEFEVHPTDTMGNWLINIGGGPAAQQYFRYRNTGTRVETLDNMDAFGRFVLVGQRRARHTIAIRSDQGKWLSGLVSYDRSGVRGSLSKSIDGQVSVRLSSASSVSYTFNAIRIPGSFWQPRSTESIHRLKIEHAAGKTVDLRAIVQISGSRRSTPWSPELNTEQPIVDVTATWRPDVRSTVYFVYNHARASEGQPGPGRRTTAHDRSLVFKVSRSFSF